MTTRYCEDSTLVEWQTSRCNACSALTVVEFDERAQVTYSALTRGELDGLTEDLPADLW